MAAASKEVAATEGSAKRAPRETPREPPGNTPAAYAQTIVKHALDQHEKGKLFLIEFGEFKPNDDSLLSSLQPLLAVPEVHKLRGPSALVTTDPDEAHVTPTEWVWVTNSRNLVREAARLRRQRMHETCAVYALDDGNVVRYAPTYPTTYVRALLRTVRSHLRESGELNDVDLVSAGPNPSAPTFDEKLLELPEAEDLEESLQLVYNLPQIWAPPVSEHCFSEIWGKS